MNQEERSVGRRITRRRTWSGWWSNTSDTCSAGRCRGRWSRWCWRRASPPGAGNPWVRMAVPTPSPIGIVLVSVSCVGPSTCVAVGYSEAPNGIRALIMRTTDGTTWTRAPVARHRRRSRVVAASAARRRPSALRWAAPSTARATSSPGSSRSSSARRTGCIGARSGPDLPGEPGQPAQRGELRDGPPDAARSGTWAPGRSSSAPATARRGSASRAPAAAPARTTCARSTA